MGLQDFKVLLADDEQEFLSTILKRLKRRNIDAIGAGSGEEALQILQSEQCDVVVLDMKMPGMDGLQTMKRIKELYPTIEVIMLTGHASIEAALEGMKAGAFDYLMKPASLNELLYKLEDAAHKKSLLERKMEKLRLAAPDSESAEP